MVWEGRDAVKTGRSMLFLLVHRMGHLQNAYELAALLGATNPLQSAPGTIRGDYAIVRIALITLPRGTHLCYAGCWPKRLPRLRQR